jgi:hypothetical protein
MLLPAVAIVVVFALALLLAITINGLSALPYVLAFVSAPIGLLAIAKHRKDSPQIAAAALIVCAPLGPLIAHLSAPLNVPLVNGSFAPFCAGLGCLGVGQIVVDRWRITWLRAPVVVALVAMVSLGVQAALATGAAADAIPPLFAALAGSVAVGIPFLVISAIFGRFEPGRLPLGYWASTAILCAFCTVVFFGLMFQPHALFSPIAVQAYRLDITFDSAQQAFVAQEWMDASFEWVDNGDVARTQDGSVLPWDQQKAIKEGSHLLDGFEVVHANFQKVKSEVGLDVLQIHLNLRRQRTPIFTRKLGMISYLSEIEVPQVLGLTPAVISRAHNTETAINVEVPEYFGLKHNLDGTIQDTLLPNGDSAKILHAHAVNDLWGIVRLRYPISLFRNPVFEKLAEFNGWSVILALLSMISGVLGFLSAVALDVIKDAKLKPVAVRVLTRLKVLRKDPANSNVTEPDIDTSG